MRSRFDPISSHLGERAEGAQWALAASEKHFVLQQLDTRMNIAANIGTVLMWLV